MNPRVQNIVEASRTLSPLEKIELIQELSRDLHETYALESAAAEFWTPHSLAEISHRYTAPIIADIHALAADFWPHDESADDINEFIARRRAADRNDNS